MNGVIWPTGSKNAISFKHRIVYHRDGTVTSTVVVPSTLGSTAVYRLCVSVLVVMLDAVLMNEWFQICSASLGSHGSVGMDQISHGLGSSTSAMQNCAPTSVVKQTARPRMPPPSRVTI